MTQISDFISNSFVLYSILSIVDYLAAAGVSIILTDTVFSLKPKIKVWSVTLTVILSIAYGIYCAYSDVVRGGEGLLYVAVGMLLPYVFMTFFFFSKKVWKSYISVFCLNLISTTKYLVLMAMPDYDYLGEENTGLELLIDVSLDVFIFIVLLAIYFLIVRKYKKTEVNYSRYLPLLIVLVVLTTLLFGLSMATTGVNFSPEKRITYIFSLLCFPAFIVTVIYATNTIIKSTVAEDSYRKIAEMQLKHFQMLEEKNDELRMFRHDFPKQMGPLLMYIKDGNTDEAEKIVSSFNVSVQNTKPRFNTGNSQLDTVLECEQQLASNHGITIDLVHGSTFPAEGVRSEDIYTIFPNALDNAIEACTILGGNTAISFESHVRGNMAFVRITNPYDGKLKIGSNGLKTRKKDKAKHGFGIRSMQKAMSSYGSGNLNYETDEGKISLNLVFELN